jgi:hypothetical protein
LGFIAVAEQSSPTGFRNIRGHRRSPRLLKGRISMAVGSSGEETDPALLNAEGADVNTANLQAEEPKTKEAEVMACYPEYWIG